MQRCKICYIVGAISCNDPMCINGKEKIMQDVHLECLVCYSDFYITDSKSDFTKCPKCGSEALEEVVEEEW